MIMNTQQGNRIAASSVFLCFLAGVIVVFTACKKDEDPSAPVLHFKVGQQYTQNGDTVAIGAPLFFGIQARSDDSYLTNLTVKKRLPGGKVITVTDTAMYTRFIDMDRRYFQNTEDEATWVFTVMDRERMMTEISLVVYKDPLSKFGGIYYHPSIKLGYQGNSLYGPFLDPVNGRVYKTDSAHLFQEDIDILCYFKTDDNPPAPVLSSPGEMDNFSTDAQTFYPTIVSWTTRNYTLWDISVDTDPISESDFNAAQHDSLLIVSYEEVWGRKKFKWATSGKIIPFKTASGKLGLAKVIHHDDQAGGYMEIAVKIQQ